KSRWAAECCRSCPDAFRDRRLSSGGSQPAERTRKSTWAGLETSRTDLEQQAAGLGGQPVGTGCEDLCCWGRRVQSFSAPGKRAPVCGVVVVSPGSASRWRQPASAKWYDRRDYVFIEFCVEDSKDVNVNFEKSKLTFSCLGGSDNFKHLNEIDLFNNIDPNESKHKRTDRSILCCLRKGESGQAWPRLTKERAKLNWLSVDFNNWKDWEDDSDEDMSNFDRFSEMMNNMGGDDDVDLPEVDGADDDSPDSDDEKMPDLE
uniref:Prostaglandin E synthase 3 n=1 Tax=Anas platyrhynchos TaxID=8839 RepID=A0A8B9T132_ANAPL